MKKFYTLFFLSMLTFIAKGQNYVTGYDYWFDSDYSHHVLVATIPQEQLFFSSDISTTNLKQGLHAFHIRFQQSSGYWSTTVSSYFFKTTLDTTGQDTTATPLITGYRYWVEGMDTAITVDVVPPSTQYFLNVDVDFSHIPTGNNILYVQFRDGQKNWSVATVDTFFKEAMPIAAFSTEDTLLCTGDSVHFHNESFDGDHYLWQFGDGDSSHSFEPVHYYQNPGIYSVSLTTSDSATGKDSTIERTAYVHVKPGATIGFTYSIIALQITLTNTTTGAFAYHWIFGDSVTSNLYSTIHTYPHGGTYELILIVQDSCGLQYDTEYVTVVQTGVENVFDKKFRITQDNNNVKIFFNETMRECHYELLNPAGQRIIFGNARNITPGYEEIFSIEGLAAGVYLLELSGDDGRRSHLIYKVY